MNRKFLGAWLVIFIAWFLGSFVVHHLLLGADYRAVAGLFRSEVDGRKFFPLMILAHVMMSGAFTWIYARGVEAKPWLGQGVRFGVAVAFLMTIPVYLMYYCVQPTPAELVVKQIVFDGALVVILGVIAGWLYRDGKA